MHSFHKSGRYLTPVLASILLVACGGGSDAPTTGSLPTAVASAVTVQNAESLAAQGHAALSNMSDQSDFAPELLMGVSVSPRNLSLLDASLALLYRKSEAGAALVTGSTITENCTHGGTASLTETGNHVSITAYNCREDSAVMNGTLSFTISNMSGTPGRNTNWEAAMALSYQQLSIEVDGIGLRINGDLTLNYKQSNFGQTTSAGINGQSLHVRYLENGTTAVNAALQSFNFLLTRNSSTYTDSGSFTYMADGTKIEAANYTVTTNTAFRRSGASYPDQGVMTLTATNNSKLILTALSSTNVRLELDLNGDGQIDETINTTWATLASKL